MEESDVGGQGTELREIINMSFAIAEWSEGEQGPALGQYQFPFSLNLPKWLPDSMLLAHPEESLSLECRYRLITQLEPWDESRWVMGSSKLGMSKLRHE